MIEYTTTHTFGQFRLIFFNRKGQKRTKIHFFHHFFKIRKKWSNLYMQYVYGKVLKCRKQNFCQFPKIIKNDLFTDQKRNKFFWMFLSFSYCLYQGQFSLFSKLDKNAVCYISRPFHRHIACKN